MLAAQHHATFSQRFAAFPLEVRLLSRFVAPAAQAATVAGLTDGTVDLVIGTHRLLSKDIRFKDLGLVVVDEEQRFGVAAKERLKQLRREVDVLTLSATPIPRTLNLALAGIRDLSVIETPPEDRLPIQTRVAEASAGLVRDAIVRELDRGGQVFYVHNRVETIEAQAEQLRRMLPDARFVVGHGQMAEGALEKVMIAFADGAADVLVCTTIIESGLDIPNANTIIIDRADTLGLAQLYQLRGRVGRSSRRAYAYLLYRRRERLTRRGPQAAPGDLQRVRAGRRLPDRAVRPRDPRAPATSSAREQSGHMAAVGFDLYSRLLAEAVEARKAALEGRAPVVEPPQAVVDLPVEAHLPDDYVPDEAQKLELYRRLARARSAGDLAAFQQEVQDRFGPMPATGPAARRGGRAAARGRGGRRGLDLARGGLARLPVRRGPDPRDGHAPARRPDPARRPAERRHLRQQPGPDPPAAGSRQELGPDQGGGRPVLGRGRVTGAGCPWLTIARSCCGWTEDDLARDILALQREAYAVEAALIGSDGIPALTETLEQLRAAGEDWLGVFDADGLCGAVAWQSLDDGTVDICRLVVAPRAFRGGVATALLDELDRRFPANPMIVSTGSGNEPALELYRPARVSRGPSARGGAGPDGHRAGATGARRLTQGTGRPIGRPVLGREANPRLSAR